MRYEKRMTQHDTLVLNGRIDPAGKKGSPSE